MLTIPKVNLKICEREFRTGGINLKAAIFQSAVQSAQTTIEPHHHRTIMTPDSPVGGQIRFDFSQDDVKLVHRVFGTQFLRRMSQPLGCSGRLCRISPVRQPSEPCAVDQSQGNIPSGPHCVGRRGARRTSRHRFQIVRVSHGSSSLEKRGWNCTRNFHHSS